MIGRWWQWLVGDSPPRVRVILYKNAHCPLCDDVLKHLAGLQPEIPHEVEVIDTEQASALDTFYRENAPVLVIAGRTRLWGRIAPALLRRELRAAQAQNRCARS